MCLDKIWASWFSVLYDAFISLCFGVRARTANSLSRVSEEKQLRKRAANKEQYWPDIVQHCSASRAQKNTNLPSCFPSLSNVIGGSSTLDAPTPISNLETWKWVTVATAKSHAFVAGRVQIIWLFAAMLFALVPLNMLAPGAPGAVTGFGWGCTHDPKAASNYLECQDGTAGSWFPVCFGIDGR